MESVRHNLKQNGRGRSPQRAAFEQQSEEAGNGRMSKKNQAAKASLGKALRQKTILFFTEKQTHLCSKGKRANKRKRRGKVNDVGED